MRKRIALTGTGIMILTVACTTGEKGATPADTATGSPTAVAPPSASAPVIAPPPESVSAAPSAKTGSSTTKPKTGVRPKAAATGSTEEPLRDSAFKPKATVDEKGNIQPIRRDTLK